MSSAATPDGVTHHLPVAIAAAIVAGVMVRVRERWFIPVPGVPSQTEDVLRSVLEGAAIAPNQYRPLMPWVDGALAAMTGAPLMSAMLIVDLALAVVLLVLLHRLCCRLGRPEVIVLAAACLAYWTMRLAHWHPELMLLTVLVTATALLLTATDPSRWLLAAVGLVMCLGRTDYAATLGLALVAAGWQRRNARLAAVGGGVVVAAVVSTVVLVRAYPAAHYVVDVIQIRHNLTTPNTAVVVLVFYGPLLLAPLWLAWRGRRWPTLWPVVLWFGLQFGATLVVGRVAESRIFLPFAPALAVVATLAFLDLRRAERSSPTGVLPPSERASVSRTGGLDVDP